MDRSSCLLGGGTSDARVRPGGEARRETPSDGSGDEASLVRALQAGERGAFEAFYRAFAPSVYRAALGLLRDPMAAEDVVVEVLWRAFRNREELDPGRSPLPWLQKVAVNRALSLLRRGRRGAESIERLAAAGEPWALASEMDGRETAIVLWRLVERLPAEQRAAVVLRYVMDLGVGEIAALLGLSPNTVKHRIAAGLRRLRAELAADEVVARREAAVLAAGRASQPRPAPGGSP